MKYQNANRVLPKELMEQIQEYVQGEYLYIPMRHKCEVKSVTDYKTELEKRNAHIYTKHLEGVTNQRLAEIYHLSQPSIRRIINKQRREYRAMYDELREVLGHWELQESEIRQVYDTAWQIGENYILKTYQDAEMLQRNLNVLHLLEEESLPVGSIILTLDGAQYVSRGDSFYFLSQKLEGSNIVKIDNAEAIALLMGETIATLHVALKKCEVRDSFWNNSLLGEMNGWVKEKLASRNWSYISGEDYERVVSRLADGYDDLPMQLIHRDVHFGNFLFDNGKFSGYIDFDLSQRNIRIFDICYFLLGLLSEEEQLKLTEEQWFIFVKNVFRGYENKLELSESEKRAVPYVMECIELLFVAYFEGVNDTHCAEDAYRIYEFVRERENKIRRILC